MFDVDTTPTYYFSMDDPEHAFSRLSDHPIELDGHTWPSVEHYYQAMQFAEAPERDRVRRAPSPRAARKAGKVWFKKRRKDWKAVRTTVMTRALYIKMRSYPDLADQLLRTEQQRLVEDSQYNYYWGCGRDKRGQNHYGRILTGIRGKLQTAPE